MSFWPPHAVGFFVSSDNIVRPTRRRENIVIGDDNGAVPLMHIGAAERDRDGSRSLRA
jgi:hypothetical protein